MKTLKDIDSLVKCFGADIPPHCRIDDLQEAAREWLAEYERLDVIAKKELGASVNWGAIIFIKHFFNLDDDNEDNEEI
jgi:hypothetical protein